MVPLNALTSCTSCVVGLHEQALISASSLSGESGRRPPKAKCETKGRGEKNNISMLGQFCDWMLSIL